MKSKPQKPKTVMNVTSPKNANQLKPQMVSPKAITKGQNSLIWNSETDLNHQTTGNQSKSSLHDDSFSLNLPLEKKRGAQKSTIENGNEGSKKIQTKKSANLFKSPTNGIMRGRQIPKKDEEDKTKKFVNEKDEKMKKLSDKIIELEESVTSITKEKQKLAEILKEIQKQKHELQKQLMVFKNMKDENKRLIKEKANAFNQNGGEIKALKDQIEILKSQKIDKRLISVEIQTIHTQPQRDADTEGSAMIAQIREYYEEMLRKNAMTIEEQRELLHEQNLQLNQLYQNKERVESNKTRIAPDFQNLEQKSLSNEARKKLEEKEQEMREMQCQLKLLRVEIEELKQEIKVKEICIKKLTEVQAQKRSWEEEREKVQQSGSEESKRLMNEKEKQISELLRKIGQQDMIIANLKANKQRVIIK